MKYSILATEGEHDQAAICKMLRLFNLRSVEDAKQLDVFWLSSLPKEQKASSSKLHRSEDVHVPYFFASETHSVAVYQGRGSSLPSNLSALIRGYRPYSQDIDALGIIVDADNNKSMRSVIKPYTDSLQDIFPFMSPKAGVIAGSSPRIGVHVLPDNQAQGTLDSVLVDCAKIVYPDHQNGADEFLNNLGTQHKSHWKPFDHKKALVAAVVSVLEPGAKNTLSIRKDDWICEQTLASVPQVALLHKFISDLLELPTPSTQSTLQATP